MDSGRPLYEVKAELFKGVGHPLRIRVLELLSEAPERTVTQLLEHLDVEPSLLSQHLAVLRRAGLVSSQRRGSLVYYALAYPSVAQLLHAARTLLTDVVEGRRAQADGLASAHQSLAPLPSPRA